MLFSSPLFLFVFFPVVLAASLAAPKAFRNAIALAASLFFYAWGEPRFLWIVLISALFDWVTVRFMARSQSPVVRRLLLSAGVTANLGLLLYYKYTHFFLGSINSLLVTLHSGSIAVPEIALPIGISFIVFEKITYVVDTYRGAGAPARNFGTYLLYVFFFPKLLAGPIIKYHDIAEQLRSRTITRDDIIAGLTRFAFGLAKKALIADTLGKIVDAIFGMPAGQVGFRNAWIGLVCFTLQIYFDFSGYSDMAIGIARVLGFHLMENFRNPYISANFTEFWRRWHISLSTWIREYLYFPLGGNRLGAKRAYFNLCLCFLLSGLWHGAQWTFVAWGLYQGVFLVLDRLIWLRVSARLPKVINIALCFFFVMLGWVIFRAESLRYAVTYWTALFRPGQEGEFLYVRGDVPFLILVGLILSFWPAVFPGKSEASPAKHGEPAAPILVPGLLAQAAAFVLLFLSIARIANATFTPFLYFRF